MLIEIFPDDERKDKYYIDDSTLNVYRTGVYKKLLPVRWTKGKYGMTVLLKVFHGEETNRYRIRKVYFAYIYGKYIIGTKRKYIIEYCDGDITNITNGNVSLKYISDLCDTWKKIDKCDTLYLSSSCLLYDDSINTIIEPYKEPSGYFMFSIKGNHIKRSILMWKTFVGTEIPNGYVIDHINNICDDDKIENLQCITTRENTKKDIKRELPHGVRKDKNRYRAYISYTIDGNKKDNVYLGSFKNKYDAAECYNRALTMVDNGIDPIKYGENENIHYLFSNDTWWFVMPQIASPDIKYKGYKTYGDALIDYHKFYIIDGNTETDVDKVKRKNYYIFKIGDLSYKIKNGKYSNVEFLKSYDYFLQCKKNGKINEFIAKIDDIKTKIKDDNYSVRLLIEKQKKDEKKRIRQEKLKNEILRREIRKKVNEDYKNSFVDKSNVNPNKYNGCFTIRVPYKDNKFYYLGSFKSKAVVDEIDRFMNDIKYKDNFIELFNKFKEEKLPRYVDLDKIERSESNESRCYKWHKSRNCWHVVKKYRNIEYSLGYYKDEKCCKMMVNEVNYAIKNGIFDIWYKNIEEHKRRIKTMFSDDTLSISKVIHKNERKTICCTDNAVNPNIHKRIKQINDNGVIGIFNTYVEASMQFNTTKAAENISLCCRGLKKNYKGYEWKFEEQTS